MATEQWNPVVGDPPGIAELRDTVEAAMLAFEHSYSGPTAYLRLSEGDRLVETPPCWQLLEDDSDHPVKEMAGVGSHASFHAFSVVPMTTSLPPLLAISWSLHQQLDAGAFYRQRCEKKFTSPNADRKPPKLPMGKLLMFVASLRRGTVDVLVLSPEGAVLVSRFGENNVSSSSAVRLLVPLYTEDGGESFWPLRYQSKRQPSLPSEALSPFSPNGVHHQRKQSIKVADQSPHVALHVATPHVVDTASCSFDTSDDDLCTRAPSMWTRARSNAGRHFVVKPRSPTFPPDGEVPPPPDPEEGQPFAHLHYPNLTIGSFGLGSLVAGGLKFKRNLLNFLITMVASLATIGISIAVLLLMLERFGTCCHDEVISNVTSPRLSMLEDPLCTWNQTLKSGLGHTTDAMLERCRSNTCEPQGTLQLEALYAYFWNLSLGEGRLLVLLIVGGFVNLVASLLLNYFVARPLALGGRPRFWAVMWGSKIIIWSIALAFTVLLLRSVERDFHVVPCNAFSKTNAHFCEAVYEECGMRLVVFFDEHPQLQHLIYGLLAVHAVGLAGSLIFPLPMEDERSNVKPAKPDVSIFRKGPYAPDGIDEATVEELQLELRRKYARPHHKPRPASRHVEGMGDFLVSARSSRGAGTHRQEYVQDSDRSASATPVRCVNEGLTSVHKVKVMHGFHDVNDSKLLDQSKKPLDREMRQALDRIEKRVQAMRQHADVSGEVLPTGESVFDQEPASKSLNANNDAYSPSHPDIFPMAPELAKIDELIHSDERREQVLENIVERVKQRTRRNVAVCTPPS